MEEEYPDAGSSSDAPPKGTLEQCAKELHRMIFSFLDEPTQTSVERVLDNSERMLENRLNRAQTEEEAIRVEGHLNYATYVRKPLDSRTEYVTLDMRKLGVGRNVNHKYLDKLCEEIECMPYVNGLRLKPLLYLYGRKDILSVAGPVLPPHALDMQQNSFCPFLFTHPKFVQLGACLAQRCDTLCVDLDVPFSNRGFLQHAEITLLVTILYAWIRSSPQNKQLRLEGMLSLDKVSSCHERYILILLYSFNSPDIPLQRRLTKKLPWILLGENDLLADPNNEFRRIYGSSLDGLLAEWRRNMDNVLEELGASLHHPIIELAPPKKRKSLFAYNKDRWALYFSAENWSDGFLPWTRKFDFDLLFENRIHMGICNLYFKLDKQTDREFFPHIKNVIVVIFSGDISDWYDKLETLCALQSIETLTLRYNFTGNRVEDIVMPNMSKFHRLKTLKISSQQHDKNLHCRLVWTSGPPNLNTLCLKIPEVTSIVGLTSYPHVIVETRPSDPRYPILEMEAKGRNHGHLHLLEHPAGRIAENIHPRLGSIFGVLSITAEEFLKVPPEQLTGIRKLHLYVQSDITQFMKHHNFAFHGPFSSVDGGVYPMECLNTIEENIHHFRGLDGVEIHYPHKNLRSHVALNILYYHRRHMFREIAQFLHQQKDLERTLQYSLKVWITSSLLSNFQQTMFEMQILVDIKLMFEPFPHCLRIFFQRDDDDRMLLEKLSRLATSDVLSYDLSNTAEDIIMDIIHSAYSSCNMDPPEIQSVRQYLSSCGNNIGQVHVEIVKLLSKWLQA